MKKLILLAVTVIVTACAPAGLNALRVTWDSAPVYFPLREGNEWKYRVRYRPGPIYSVEKEKVKEKEYVETWKIVAARSTNVKKNNAFEVKKISKVTYIVAITTDDRKCDNHTAFFTGFSTSGDGADQRVFVFQYDPRTRDDRMGADVAATLRLRKLMPLRPRVKKDRTWHDSWYEGDNRVDMDVKIVAFEGIQTEAGYFEDCMVTCEVNTISNQVVRSRTYKWYAPHIGMVKALQEILYIDDKELPGRFVVEEYDLLSYKTE